MQLSNLEWQQGFYTFRYVTSQANVMVEVKLILAKKRKQDLLK